MRTLKIAIVGYGKMGQEIAAILKKRGHIVTAYIDPLATDTPAVLSQLSDLQRGAADVAIDFTHAHAFLKNYPHYVEQVLPVVVGTTGWDEEQSAILDAFSAAHLSYIVGSNFSIGAHILFQLTARAAQLIAHLPQYDIMVSEAHHKHKIDSPSGTARTIANTIIAQHPRKKRIVSDALQRAIVDDEIHVSSLRGGAIPGIHTVYLDSEHDRITLQHTAHGRSGFALGAVLATEWLVENPGGYMIEDIIPQLLKRAV